MTTARFSHSSLLTDVFFLPPLSYQKLDTFPCRYRPCFHRWFLETFADPTSWFEARTLFTRSAAVWSAVGHVVGLGDRHGENILIDTTSGECVHVDFDCLFDKGLTLTLPEIVPFRLTPNMVDAMGLTGYEGSFRGVMELTMRLLRENKDMLVSVLEPFIRDPTVAWGRTGRAQREITGRQKAGGAVHDTVNSDAQQALERISERLDGIYNIAKIAEAIRQNRGTVPPSLAPATAGAESLPLSVEGQVHRLIQEATSNENLVQMYIGWMPWM